MAVCSSLIFQVKIEKAKPVFLKESRFIAVTDSSAIVLNLAVVSKFFFFFFFPILL